MAIQALFLFGSRARGDATPESDTDLLGWSNETFPKHVTRGDVSLAVYPGAQLLRMARNGDLFIAHLVLEAVVIHDPDGRMSILRDAYVPRVDYADQIAAASNLGWFLVDHHAALDPGVVNARAAWCARTIAIARTAEKGTPIFSPEALAKSIDSTLLPLLLANRNTAIASPELPVSLRDFLERHANGRSLPSDAAVDRYARMFRETGNSFAQRTIAKAGLKDENGFYI